MSSHTLSCTFCKRSEHQVAKLVAGPGVYICDACIEIAHRIVHESDPTQPDAPRTMTPLRRLGAWLGSLGRRGNVNAEIAAISAFKHSAPSTSSAFSTARRYTLPP